MFIAVQLVNKNTKYLFVSITRRIQKVSKTQ